jgi:hypothetical protein
LNGTTSTSSAAEAAERPAGAGRFEAGRGARGVSSRLGPAGSALAAQLERCEQVDPAAGMR